MAHDYVENVTTEMMGGGCTCDRITLKSGHVIGVNDECVVVYANADCFWNAYSDENAQSAPIWLNELKAPLDKDAIIARALDAACAAIQKELGQTDGGPAAQFFSGANEEAFMRLMGEYIDYEQEGK